MKGNAEKQDDTSLLVVSSVPQKRKRMFDLATRPDVQDINYDNILEDSSLVRDWSKIINKGPREEGVNDSMTLVQASLFMGRSHVL